MEKQKIGRTLTVPASSPRRKGQTQRGKSMKSLRQSSDEQDSASGSGGNWSCPNSPLVKKAFRLIVSGSTKTGKSAIVNRFLNDKFTDSYLPTIENFHRKMYKIRGEMYQLDILDTSGNDPFPAARRISLLTGDIFLVVCSMDNADTMEEAFRLRQEIVECKTEKFCDQKYTWVPTVIVANKSDLPEHKVEVDTEDCGRRLQDVPDCSFFVCSAKTAQNIDDIFGELFRLAKFPKQMSPKAHRRLTAEKSADLKFYPENKGAESNPVSSSSRKTWKTSSLGGLKRKDKEPEAVSYQDVEARRPSLRTDLLVLKAKASHGYTSTASGQTNGALHRNQKNKKCSIQ